MQTASDKNPNVNVIIVFLDISKRSEKFRHNGFIFKFKPYGVEGKLLSLLKSYLQARAEWVVVHDQTCGWRNVNSGITQGWVLGPLLFLIYINDRTDGITSMCKFFAHTTSLFSKVLDLNRSLTELNTDLEKTSPWAFQWKMQFNPDSNKQINKVIWSHRLVSNISSQPNVKINNSNNTGNSHQKHLGVILDLNLNFSTHIDQKIK